MFSILVVCLNPGDKLRTTLESIREQTFRNYEVIIKDGLSSDGSLDFVKEVTEEFPVSYTHLTLPTSLIV